MKKFTTVIMLLLAISIAKAQTEEGNFILGSNVGNISIPLDEFGSTSFSLTPNVGYFIKDNIALGATIPISYSRWGDSDWGGSLRGLGFGFYGRYYIPQDNFSFFTGAGFGVNNYRDKDWYIDIFDGSRESDSNTYGTEYANIHGGIAYFLNKSIGAEASLIIGDLLNPGTQLSINLGLNIYFNRGGE